LHGRLDDYGKNKIAQAILTHPHHDHISDCGPLSENRKLHPTLITCPNDKDVNDAVKWERIKNRDGNKSLLKYKALYESRQLPLQTIKHTSRHTAAHELEYGIYYVKPSVCDGLHKIDNEYGNSLSIVTYFRFGTNSILFPGDITPLAMEKILNQRE
jgi:beta-lactamase superfamily II metal-dependent hydrolase